MGYPRLCLRIPNLAQFARRKADSHDPRTAGNVATQRPVFGQQALMSPIGARVSPQMSLVRLMSLDHEPVDGIIMLASA